ncbi:LPD11 domain-containing protein [Paenibacillus sp. Leaf72]|uniref:LPD11 domain-containing protein n=1 Tax=Paenibacillus sp. Leaf72 TaxID=1736234 RepID=UPI0006F2068D|nr:LPD11 domain-containing protein [Paenibacillus sp. Leaf72]KQN96832.1 hypothetical protein ASF12_22435 [Paenibacillus sp. Leaf72]
MEAKANVRTMEYIGLDFWERPVYKCIENSSLWKDIELGKSDKPVLYSCENDFGGEPCSPIKSDLVVIFISKYAENPHRFNYMMLSRLRSDCDYYLGFGNRNEKHLCCGNVKEHIERMKAIYNSFPEGQKPERLTYEGILEYEKRMSE